MRLLFLASLLFLSLTNKAQELTQTIRGKVLDQESEFTLPGASIIITSLEPELGTSTDLNGYFELKNVPIGRHNIIVRFLGYREVKLSNVLVGSAKEVVLTIRLSESYQAINEVVVVAEKNKEKTNNEMATVSARSFSTEETSKYAASVDDPARMAQAFAGVSSTDDISNEIIVRGNNPIGLLWRMNGIEIPSPNHFSEEGSSGGGISALSINMLDNSDFFTGAFPAEYGNATSGVFDVKLRNGNSNQREHVFQLGVLGTDISTEGPFKKGSNASYLINYRYSTLGLLTKMGIIDLGGDNTTFQDLALQINVPTAKLGVFKLFGLSGISLSESSIDQAFFEEQSNVDYYEDDFTSNFGVVGVSNQYFLNENCYLKNTLSYATQSIGYEERSRNNFNRTNTLLYEEKFINSAYRLNSYLNYKLNVKHTIRSGFILSRLAYDLYNDGVDENGNRRVLIDEAGNTNQLQGYSQWKYRFHEDWTLNTGFHYLYFALNGNQSFEPRMGLSYQINDIQKISVGFGLHSRVAPLSFYNSDVTNADGSISKANKDTELSKSLHYVLGYDRQLSENLRMKVEVYYQDLYDIPVSPELNSTASGINYTFGLVTSNVISDGSASNVGAELTLEKFLSNNLYYLFTTSIFNSKYEMPDGREFNTRFNSNYRFTLLGGKEFSLKKSGKNVLGLNAKIIWAGGNRYTPINLEASKNAQTTVRFEDRAFENQVPAYWRADITASYRINNEKVAHIVSLQIQNITARENVFTYYFDEETQQIEASTQFGLIPVLKYRIEF